MTFSSPNSNFSGRLTVNAGLVEFTTPGALPTYNVSNGLGQINSGATLALSVGGTGWSTGSILSLVSSNGASFFAGSTLALDAPANTSFLYSGYISGATLKSWAPAP